MNNPFKKGCDVYNILITNCCNLGDNQIFTYNGKYLQGIAILEGVKCIDLKNNIKSIGFRYEVHIECYSRIKSNVIDGYEFFTIDDVRVDKNEMIEDLIEWKLKTNEIKKRL